MGSRVPTSWFVLKQAADQASPPRSKGRHERHKRELAISPRLAAALIKLFRPRYLVEAASDLLLMLHRRELRQRTILHGVVEGQSGAGPAHDFHIMASLLTEITEE
jgi:hypothetical protein